MPFHDLFPVEFEGDYYDLKSFLHDHPGGVNTLKYYKGKSILHVMEKFGHSSGAYHLLKDFKVDSHQLKGFNLDGGVSRNGRIITSEEKERNIEEIKFLEELEGRLDWSQPIVSQLKLIAPHYEKWVNTAVYRKCRLFANPLLESLTFTPWYLVPIFWVPIILYIGITQYMRHVGCQVICQDTLSRLEFLYHVAFGVLIWTGVEYSLHRWVFHLNPGSSLIMIKLHFLLHGLHHKMPFDGLRQVFPPIPALLLAAVVYLLLHPFFAYPTVKLIGGLVGYLSYDMIHYYIHHGAPRDGTYLYMMKRYHSNHHFINHDKAFGVSCKLWDHIFRTLGHVKRLRFNLHW